MTIFNHTSSTNPVINKQLPLALDAGQNICNYLPNIHDTLLFGKTSWQFRDMAILNAGAKPQYAQLSELIEAIHRYPWTEKLAKPPLVLSAVAPPLTDHIKEKQVIFFKQLQAIVNQLEESVTLTNKQVDAPKLDALLDIVIKTSHASDSNKKVLNYIFSCLYALKQSDHQPKNPLKEEAHRAHALHMNGSQDLQLPKHQCAVCFIEFQDQQRCKKYLPTFSTEMTLKILCAAISLDNFQFWYKEIKESSCADKDLLLQGMVEKVASHSPSIEHLQEVIKYMECASQKATQKEKKAAVTAWTKAATDSKDIPALLALIKAHLVPQKDTAITALFEATVFKIQDLTKLWAECSTEERKAMAKGIAQGVSQQSECTKCQRQAIDIKKDLLIKHLDGNSPIKERMIKMLFQEINEMVDEIKHSLSKRTLLPLASNNKDAEIVAQLNKKTSPVHSAADLMGLQKSIKKIQNPQIRSKLNNAICNKIILSNTYYETDFEKQHNKLKRYFSSFSHEEKNIKIFTQELIALLKMCECEERIGALVQSLFFREEVSFDQYVAVVEHILKSNLSDGIKKITLQSIMLCEKGLYSCTHSLTLSEQSRLDPLLKLKVKSLDIPQWIEEKQLSVSNIINAVSQESNKIFVFNEENQSYLEQIWIAALLSHSHDADEGVFTPTFMELLKDCNVEQKYVQLIPYFHELPRYSQKFLLSYLAEKIKTTPLAVERLKVWLLSRPPTRDCRNRSLSHLLLRICLEDNDREKLQNFIIFGANKNDTSIAKAYLRIQKRLECLETLNAWLDRHKSTLKRDISHHSERWRNCMLAFDQLMQNNIDNLVSLKQCIVRNMASQPCEAIYAVDKRGFKAEALCLAEFIENSTDSHEMRLMLKPA